MGISPGPIISGGICHCFHHHHDVKVPGVQKPPLGSSRRLPALPWASRFVFHSANSGDFAFLSIYKHPPFLLHLPSPPQPISFPSSRLCCYEVRSGAHGTQ